LNACSIVPCCGTSNQEGPRSNREGPRSIEKALDPTEKALDQTENGEKALDPSRVQTDRQTDVRAGDCESSVISKLSDFSVRNIIK